MTIISSYTAAEAAWVRENLNAFTSLNKMCKGYIKAFHKTTAPARLISIIKQEGLWGEYQKTSNSYSLADRNIPSLPVIWGIDINPLMENERERFLDKPFNDAARKVKKENQHV